MPSPSEFDALSAVGEGLTLSPILSIAAAVRERAAAGWPVTDFTIGDFSPRHFRPPPGLAAHLAAAVDAGHTHYPPATGVRALRDAIRRSCADALGLDVPEAGLVVAAGARPPLYAAYRCLVSPGEVVVAPAPHWNNDAYCHLVGARLVTVPGRPQDGFLPTAEALAPALAEARLLVLNSPMNPSGAMFRPEPLAAICRRVVAENRRRAAAGRRALYVLYDQIYHLLGSGRVRHVTPAGLVPEVAPHTLLVDGISKAFAATGLRVGWLIGPPRVIGRATILLAEIGAWAPHPEQHAAAAFLEPSAEMSAWLRGFRQSIQQRLGRLYRAFARWSGEGLPVKALAPEGAIYLSVHFDLEGRAGLPDQAAIQAWLLRAAGWGALPFSVFGDRHNRGWFRMSVGAVGLDELDECIERLDAALRALP